MRLDRYLVVHGDASSRTQAQQLIAEGRVTIGGRRVVKASASIGEQDPVTVTAHPRYVSRAALKLLGAFESFPDLTADGRVALDAGASTGGFTQVLLERGASQVYAVDVGHDQLSPVVAKDPRVVNCEHVNLRSFVRADLPIGDTNVELVVADLSFISLTLVLPTLVREISATDFVVLVKPQFEVGKSLLGHRGVVKDPRLRAAAVDHVLGCAENEGLAVRGIDRAAITGATGNQEYVVWLSKDFSTGDGRTWAEYVQTVCADR